VKCVSVKCEVCRGMAINGKCSQVCEVCEVCEVCKCTVEMWSINKQILMWKLWECVKSVRICESVGMWNVICNVPWSNVE
jgi:hypothetical protein